MPKRDAEERLRILESAVEQLANAVGWLIGQPTQVTGGDLASEDERHARNHLAKARQALEQLRDDGW